MPLKKGEVSHVDPVRYTPAGILALNLTLKHNSEQIEANLKRTISCELSAKIMGNTALMPVKIGDRLKVKGFIGNKSALKYL
jgi:primosomal replication protein N